MTGHGRGACPEDSACPGSAPARQRPPLACVFGRIGSCDGHRRAGWRGRPAARQRDIVRGRMDPSLRRRRRGRWLAAENAENARRLRGPIVEPAGCGSRRERRRPPSRACGWLPETRRAGPCRLGQCGATPDRRSTLTLGRQSSLRRSGEPGDAGRHHRRPASTRSRSFPKEQSRAPPVPRCCRCARRGIRATGNWPRSARRPRSGAGRLRP